MVSCAIPAASTALGTRLCKLKKKGAYLGNLNY